MPDHPAEMPPAARTENRFSGEAFGPVIQTGTIGSITINAGEAQPPAVPVLASAGDYGTSNEVLSFEEPGLRLNPEALFSPELGVKVLVEALTAQAVVLQGMRAVVESRTPPRPVFAVMCALSPLELRGFTVDLDAERPRLKPTSATGPDFPFTVTSSDPELFVVLPRSAFEVHWRLELDWTSRGRSGTVVIDRDGQPFHFVPGPRR